MKFTFMTYTDKTISYLVSKPRIFLYHNHDCKEMFVTLRKFLNFPDFCDLYVQGIKLAPIFIPTSILTALFCKLNIVLMRK